MQLTGLRYIGRDQVFALKGLLRVCLALLFASPLAGWSRDPVSAYQSRINALDHQVRKDGKVNYRASLKASYASNWLDFLLEEKAQYREWLMQRSPLFADYSTVDRDVDVARAISRVVVSGMTEAATYYVAKDRILVRTEENPGRSILHEAGHSLQHARLFELGQDAKVCDRRLARLIPKDREPRLEYLLQQAEIEVRLQDLNRFYALFHSGVPIINPEDSVRALAMLGCEIDSSDVERAMSRLGISWPSSGAEPLLWQEVQADPTTRAAFADAFTLVELLRLSRQRSQELYEAVLAKVIFEAPAHL